jgi:hypothetical protein
VIAIGAQALPVYEIYKVGQDLHWQPGLNLFGAYGLQLAFVPHWNNTEGGTELDTSRCFMGEERFERLLAMLPPDLTVVGIDEHTALLADLEAGTAEVIGSGNVTIIRPASGRPFATSDHFPLSELGPFHQPRPDAGLPPDVWTEAMSTAADEHSLQRVPAEVMALVIERQAARAQRDWARSDALRARIAVLGWHVDDAPDGPVVTRLP